MDVEIDAISEPGLSHALVVRVATVVARREGNATIKVDEMNVARVGRKITERVCWDGSERRRARFGLEM